jgi:hypothetical protein
MHARWDWMGNRGGCLHDEHGTVEKRRWVSRRWIVCTVDYKRRGSGPESDKYTKLFFPDETTALAAGHRPCFLCRREAAREFFDRWQQQGWKLDDLDRRLHEDRLSPRQEADPASLPHGTMVEAEGAAWRVESGGLRRWTFGGYRELMAMPPLVTVLTPAVTVEILRRGYRPR